MKNYTHKIIGILCIICGLSTIFSIKQCSSYEEKYEKAQSNVKALAQDNLKDSVKVLNFTIEQLKYFNDSINSEFVELQKKYKIKNKNLTQVQYIKSEIIKHDTLITTDTIFKKDVKLDTIIGDKWSKSKLYLEYPGTVSISTQMVSEKYLLFHNKRETVNPPKKYWIQRIFQKKHWVTEVQIEEKNPYIQSKENRFINIIK